jgi:GT2 family glycosyltransferase
VTERRRHLRLTVQRAEVEAEPVGPPSRASERALASPSAVASSAPAATSELRAAPADAEAHAGTLVEPEPTPVLSVIVVSYNCRLPLAACLSSLEAQRDELPLEVILVDNDSRDGTAYEVASRFPWVRLVVNRGNVGFARAVNTGLRFSRGEYLLVLNPDTVAPVGSIARAVHELERHPDVGMLGCKLVRPDGSFDHACKRGFPTVRSAIYYFTGLARAFPKSARFAQYTAAHLSVDEAGPVDAVNGAFMLVRRAAAEDVGELDERYWLWAEDLDWCHRFWERGWKVLYWPEVEVIHLKSFSVGNHRSLRLNFAFHRSIWLFYAKHYAPRRSPFLTALVWLGIWSKFGGSTLVNGIRRRPDAQRR